MGLETDNFFFILDGLYLIQGELPVWVLTACIGVFLSGIVFFTTTNERPPAYHFVGNLHLITFI